MTSYKRHGTRNNRQLSYLLNSLFKLTSKKITKIPLGGESPVAALCEGNPRVTGGIPSLGKGPVTRKAFPSHDVIMAHEPQIFATCSRKMHCHYNDVIMSSIASQITSLTIFYSAVYSGTDQRKHQSPASLAFTGGIHRWPVNSPHKWPVTRKRFPFDDIIMWWYLRMLQRTHEPWSSFH